MTVPHFELINELLSQANGKSRINLQQRRAQKISELERMVQVVAHFFLFRALNFAPHYFEQIADQASQIVFLEKLELETSKDYEIFSLGYSSG